MTHRLRWHISARGNQYAYVGNFLLTIFSRGPAYCVALRYLVDRSTKCIGPYESFDAACRAGLELVERAQTKLAEREAAIRIEAVEPATQEAIQ